MLEHNNRHEAMRKLKESRMHLNNKNKVMGLEANSKMKQNLDEHPSHQTQYLEWISWRLGCGKLYHIIELHVIDNITASCIKI